MPYYFRPDQSIRSLKKLKEYQKSRAESIAQQLANLLHASIRHYWTRRDTFGFVFADFEYTQKGHQRLIGKGELDLFRRVKEDFYCVVLSTSLTRNFDIFQLGQRKGIRINLAYFKDFLSVLRDSSKTVRLFLYRFDKQNDEELIRRWLKNYDGFDRVQLETRTDADWMRGTIEKYDIQDAESLEAIITLARATQSKAWAKLEPYEEKLTAFQKLVDRDAEESDLHDFLFNNLWMIDVRYQLYQKKIKKEPLDVGQVDIALYKDAIGIERVAIIELKKAGKEIITESYRGVNKPAIMAEFGKALSQTIHYVESLRTKRRTIEGIVIIGRKKDVKDWFVDKFNEYLHGIKVLTYDDILDDARNVVKMLREMEDELAKVALPEPEIQPNEDSISSNEERAV